MYSQDTSYRQKVGKYGEGLATNYLISKQYVIIARNIKNSHQELDIIATLKGQIIFIEVKTRVNNIYGSANEALGPRKMINFKKAVKNYCDYKNIDLNIVRMDLIAIDINKSNKIANIQHYIAVA